MNKQKEFYTEIEFFVVMTSSTVMTHVSQYLQINNNDVALSTVIYVQLEFVYISRSILIVLYTYIHHGQSSEEVPVREEELLVGADSD